MAEVKIVKNSMCDFLYLKLQFFIPQEKGIENYQFTNWSEIVSCNPSRYFEPNNIEGLREVILFSISFLFQN